MTWKELLPLFGQGTLETLYMTLGSALIAYGIGLPVGFWLAATDPGGICPSPAVNRIAGGIVNLLRSVPFLILLVALKPFTRLVTGTSIGSAAMIVPLIVSGAPYIARMVESSAKEVDRGVIEASLAMGASPLQVILKVILPESKPSLIVGAAISVTTILGYSAMAGIVGGGGLGGIAINYGYYRTQTGIMLAMIVLLILLVQILQEVGDSIARRSDKRIR